MKRHFAFKLCAFFLSAALFIFAIPGERTVLASWEDDDYDWLDEALDDDYDGPAGESGEEDPPYIEPVWSISTYSDDVSFGTNIEDSEYYECTIPVVIYNEGTVACDIVWSEYDPMDFFTVDAPSDLYLPVGGSMQFNLTLNNYLSSGNYSGNMYFQALQDSSSGISVDVSTTIIPKEPRVWSVSITPQSVTLNKGGEYQFDALVSGENLRTNGVEWIVRGMSSSSTGINDNGLLHVGADEESNSLQVVAVAKEDRGVEDRASISVKSNYYNIYVKSLEGGNVSGGGTYEGGKAAELFASPDNGYEFVGWYENNSCVSTSKKLVIENINGDRSFEAHFKKQLCYVVLSVSPDKSGKVAGEGYYDVGSKVTLKATPKDGYRFVCWRRDGETVSKDKEYTINRIDSDMKLKAVFEPDEYTVKICVTPDGAGKVEGEGKYEKGKKVTLKETAMTGYKFKGWYSDSNIVSVSDKLVIDKIEKDYCICAVYEKEAAKAYAMMSSATKGGVIIPAGTYPVVEGVNVTYVITPDPGYKIDKLNIDGKDVAASDTYVFANIKGNHSIVASFAKKEDAGGNREVTPSVNKPTGKNMNEYKSDAEAGKTTADTSDADKEVNYDELRGILQKYNMTPDEAYAHLYDSLGEEMFVQAFREGYVRLVVNNDYSENKHETEKGDFYKDPSMPNFWTVINSSVTDEEALGVLSGKELDIHIDITDMTGFISDEAARALNEAAEGNSLAWENVFDITFLRSYDGVMSNVKTLSEEAEFTLNVPRSILEKSEIIKIIHVKDEGGSEILEDLDDNPDTVTFRTSSFSDFAFAYPSDKKLTASKVEKSTDNEKGKIVSNKDTEGDNRRKTAIFLVAVFAALCVTFGLVIAVSASHRDKKKRK